MFRAFFYACAMNLASSPVAQAVKYFLVTFHGGDDSKGSVQDINNIYKYSMDGEFLGQLISHPQQIENQLRSLRGFEFHFGWFAHNAQLANAFCRMLTYSQQPNQPPSRMWVINAYKEDSRIMELHNFCEPDPEGLGKAEISTWASSPLDHPYALSLKGDGTLLAGNQNTGDVVRFNINQAPGSPGEVLANVSLAFPQQDGNGPRGLCWTPDGNYFWVAVQEDAEHQHGLYRFDKDGNPVNLPGIPNNWVSIDKPIDIYCDGDLIYVSSNAKKQGAVYTVNMITGSADITHPFTHPDLIHPCGLLTEGNSLYVLAQSEKLQLLQFSLATREFEKAIVSPLCNETSPTPNPFDTPFCRGFDQEVPEDLIILTCPDPPTPPTEPPTSAPTSSNNPGRQSRGGSPIGLVVGGAAGVIFVVAAIFCILKRKKAKGGEQADTTQGYRPLQDGNNGSINAGENHTYI